MQKIRVFADTNVILESFRTGCWTAISNHFAVETVEKCIEEALTGDPTDPRYVVVDQQVLLSAAQARGVLPGQPAQISTTWTPPSLPAGDYTVHLAWVRQPALAALPQTLRWNMAGIEADGSARLVTLRR